MIKNFITKISNLTHKVIIEKIRNNKGIPCTELKKEEKLDSIMFNPKGEGPLIVNKKGVLVVKPELNGSVEELIQRNRLNRIRHVWVG